MDVSSDYQLLWSTVEVRRTIVRKTTTGDQLRAGLLRMPRNRDPWILSASDCFGAILVEASLAPCSRTRHHRGMPDVEAAFEAFIAAFNVLDFERFRRCLSTEVSLFAPDSYTPSLIEGAAAVERHFRAVFRDSAPEGPGIRPASVRVRPLDERASLITFEFARRQGSTGRRSIVFRLEDGEWKILHIHASNISPEE